MQPKSKGGGDDSFSVFLDTLKKSSITQSPSTDSPPSEHPAGLLQFLVHPQTVAQLLSMSGMNLNQLAATLTTLKEAGLIEAGGLGANDTVDLTDLGRKLVAAAAIA
jgi:hypothetical protein